MYAGESGSGTLLSGLLQGGAESGGSPGGGMAYAGGGAAAELGPELVAVHATFPFSSLSPPPTPSPEHLPSSRYELRVKILHVLILLLKPSHSFSFL